MSTATVSLTVVAFVVVAFASFSATRDDQCLQTLASVTWSAPTDDARPHFTFGRAPMPFDLQAPFSQLGFAGANAGRIVQLHLTRLIVHTRWGNPKSPTVLWHYVWPKVPRGGNAVLRFYKRLSITVLLN